MTRDEVKKMADAGIEQLAKSLEAGQSDALLKYLANMAKFHRYSIGNVMLILSQRPDATHVAGFNTWKKLGRSVRKGEKGIAILAPIVSRRRGREAEDDKENDRALRGFRVAHVFDVSQTDGKPLPELGVVRGDPGQHLQNLKAEIQQRGIELEYADLPGASGVSRGGQIAIIPGLSPAEEFSVLVHEYAHERLHHRADERSLTTKKIRETEAEAISFVVSHAIGLDTNTAASDYIQLYRGTKETLVASLERIQKTATEILTALESASDGACVPPGEATSTLMATQAHAASRMAC